MFSFSGRITLLPNAPETRREPRPMVVPLARRATPYRAYWATTRRASTEPGASLRCRALAWNNHAALTAPCAASRSDACVTVRQMRAHPSACSLLCKPLFLTYLTSHLRSGWVIMSDLRRFFGSVFTGIGTVRFLEGQRLCVLMISV